jgi:DNA-binding LacI/PurR family transcriptional regulator
MKKYIQIKEAILSEISSGKLKTGEKLPVREELIKKYSVTRATLNKAITELIRSGKLVACRNKGTFVAEKTKNLKMALVSNFHVDEMPLGNINFFHRMDALQHIIISSAQGKMDFLDSEKVEKNLNILSEYDSAIWVVPNDKALEDLKNLKHKVVAVNRYGDDISFVSTNHRKALFDMTEYFINKFGGDCNLVYLDIEDNNFISVERREGFIEACEKNRIFYRFSRMSRNFEKSVETLMKLKLDPSGKNVIVSPSHMTTGAVLRMAYLKGLKPGEDFFYSDFDNADSLLTSGVKIPSILQDYKIMGEEVIKAAKNIVDGPVQKFAPHHLVNI